MTALSECHVGVNVIACYGPIGIHRVTVMDCWKCHHRTDHIRDYDGYWNGCSWTCISCGYSDAYGMDRAQIDELRATALSGADFDAWLALDRHRNKCEDEECRTCNLPRSAMTEALAAFR